MTSAALSESLSEPVASAPEPKIHATDPVSMADTGFYLPLASLVVDRDLQTRHDRDETVIASIRASMVARIAAGRHPQETPAWVVRRGAQFVLLAGFTRYALLSDLAAEANDYARQPTIWVTVKEAPTVYRALVLNMRENLERQTLSVADEAEGYARLRRLDPTRTIAEIAKETPRSASAVENLIRAYEKTSPEIWSAFRRGVLPQRAVLKLAAIEDKAAQRDAFERLTDPERRRADREAAAAERARAAATSSADTSSPLERSRAEAMARLWAAFDGLRIRWYMQGHDAPRTEYGEGLALVLAHLEHAAGLVAHPALPSVDVLVARAFAAPEGAEAEASGDESEGAEAEASGDESEGAEVEAPSDESEDGEPRSLYGAENRHAVHFVGAGQCPKASAAKRRSLERVRVTCAWCASGMREAERAKAPQPSKGAKAPKPSKGAKAPKPSKGARAPKPSKGARAPKPSKAAEARKAARRGAAAKQRMAEFWGQKAKA